jgi:hypothetical protein
VRKQIAWANDQHHLCYWLIYSKAFEPLLEEGLNLTNQGQVCRLVEKLAINVNLSGRDGEIKLFHQLVLIILGFNQLLAGNLAHQIKKGLGGGFSKTLLDFVASSLDLILPF